MSFGLKGADNMDTYTRKMVANKQMKTHTERRTLQQGEGTRILYFFYRCEI